MKYRELRKLFKEHGWEKLTQKGSHEKWGKGGLRTTIAGKDSQEVSRAALNGYLKDLGLK